LRGDEKSHVQRLCQELRRNLPKGNFPVVRGPRELMNHLILLVLLDDGILFAFEANQLLL
jgi:hypothetical protein